MSIIVRQDTNGVKPLLQVGELGYDNFPAGGDEGRVWVGTGASNIAQAKKAEVMAVDSKVDAHIPRVDNPHSVTKAQVGLGNVDNTSDANKPISTATQNALGLKADAANAVLTGIPTAPTAAVGTSTTQLATTAYVKAEIVDSAPTKTGTGASGIWGISVTGNSATATKLATARTVNGVAFDGTANIVAPTNLGITAGTTAGPIVTSSTGTNATLPTASASASGVVTTGNQTWVGVKTFSSSPIVPTPTTDFQATTARSTNITVDVGAGQTYTTINQALEYLSGFYPLYKTTGVTATINLKAGFVMNEQVLVSGLNLGWITIVGEDAETIITHTALTTSFNGLGYPAFGVNKGGTSPVIGQLFRFNVEKVGGDKYGLMTYGVGSSADVLTGKGFIGAGTHGIMAYNSSTINANGANASNAGGVGIYALNGSTINAQGANASGAGSSGIAANNASTINANGANASNAKSVGIYANAGSTINAYLAIIQNQTAGTSRVGITGGSTINAVGINTTGGTVPDLSQTANTLAVQGIIYR